MLDAQYLRDVLFFVEQGSYSGVTTEAVVKNFASDIFDENVKRSDEFDKFYYHMDEAWAAGLIRRRRAGQKDDWGCQFSSSGTVLLRSVDLVLSPVGGEALAELQKSKGAERLISALRSAGAAAGKEALSRGIEALLRASI